MNHWQTALALYEQDFSIGCERETGPGAGDTAADNNHIVLSIVASNAGLSCESGQYSEVTAKRTEMLCQRGRSRNVKTGNYPELASSRLQVRA